MIYHFCSASVKHLKNCGVAISCSLFYYDETAAAAAEDRHTKLWLNFAFSLHTFFLLSLSLFCGLFTSRDPFSSPIAARREITK